MKNSLDPSTHRQCEKQFVSHVEALLEDQRLRLDTTRGHRAVTNLLRNVTRKDHGVELKRLMTEIDKPDRQLQAQMPLGEILDVDLWQKSLGIFKKHVGRLQVACVSPTRELLDGKPSPPLNAAGVNAVLHELAGLAGARGVPSTVVIMSTTGFARETHELAQRTSERTLILVEPNDAGGWNVTGPSQTKALVDLFDPEKDLEKRSRLRQFIQEQRGELLSGGLSADTLAAKTRIPQQIVEAELKSYARENPGLAAKRLDGRWVLFQDATSAAPAPASAGGEPMPFIDRMKALFSRKGDEDKKAALLAERKAALSQQRDRLFEDMSLLEQKEAELRQQFKDSASALSRRRLTSQLLQFHKDIERRQQLLGMLGQQVNVVSTALHNLELTRQGQAARLPTSDELTADAEKAEQIMAELEVNNELATSISSAAASGMSNEEQELYEQLEKEAAAEKTSAPSPAPKVEEASKPAAAPDAVSEPAQEPDASGASAPPAAGAPQRRSEPEPG
jgi:hypothetical protein